MKRLIVCLFCILALQGCAAWPATNPSILGRGRSLP